MDRLSLRAAALLLLSAVAVADPLTCPTADQTSYTAAGGDAFLIQCGVDFAGGDLSAVYSATFNDCLDACDATTGCLAVAYNGNNCYMKSDIDGGNANAAVWGASKLAAGTQPSRPLACPASDGVQVVEAKGHSYTIQCGIDHYGGDLRSLVTANFEACLLVCDSTPACVAVSYHDSGYCYLKNTLTPSQAEADVWGAVLTDLATTSTGSTATTRPTCPGADGTVITEGNTRFLVQCGIDHYGGDLSSSFTQTFEACLEACAANPACVALTFAGPEPGYCYLKNAVTDAVGGGGNQWGAIVIPGPPGPSPVACPGADGLTVQEGGKDFVVHCSTDYFGGDLASEYANTFDQCLIICAVTPGCIAVSFNGPGPTYCYLKNAITDDVRQNGAVWGAVLAIASSSTTVSASASSPTTVSASSSVTFSNTTVAASTTTVSASASFSVTFSNTTVAASTTTVSASASSSVTFSNTTVAASTTTAPPSTATINTSAGYVIVSPSSCPTSTPPTGSPIGQSSSSFSAAYGGLQYTQYSNSQFIIQDANSGPFYVDLSSDSTLTISDTKGDTLIIYANGTYEAFVGNCEIEIVGTWTDTSSSSNAKRNTLEKRQSSGGLCDDLQLYCDSRLGVLFSSLAGGFLCASIGAELGADIGGGIGFLGNILGPEVGIPTTIAGVYLGGALGGFIAGRIGQTLCAGATGLLADSLCKACPPKCGFGTISCNGGPCQDALSDPNNCGKCGNVCASGICANGACSAPTCNGAACGGIQACTGGCFCFEGASTIGFCGQNTPCALDPPCSSDADCGLGSVCAVNTCCGNSICLAVCSTETVKRGLRNNVRTLGGGTLGSNATYPAGFSSGS